MSEFKTEQEAFWAGAFGEEYIGRNQGANVVASNTALFADILRSTGAVDSVVEFGANIGLNLLALRNLLPDVRLSAVEINGSAVEHLRRLDGVEAIQASILDVELPRRSELALIKGVLIHIAPEFLERVYDRLESAAERFVVIAEYYNTTPATVPYRGHADRLFKRDFAGEFLRRFPTFKLRDYGFVYRGDAAFPQDDITWFLLERR